MSDPLEVTPNRLLAVAESILAGMALPPDVDQRITHLLEMRDEAVNRSDYEGAAELRERAAALNTRKHVAALVGSAGIFELDQATQFLKRCGYLEQVGKAR